MQEQTPSESTPTVLVIDDTPANLLLLEQMLVRGGYRVMQFPCGRRALRAALKRPPDLVLLDIMMPEMDGFAVCRALKAVPGLREVPVVFISAVTDTPNKVRAFQEGGVDFVSKPFHEEEVLARVDTHVTLYRMRQALEGRNQELADLVQDKMRESSEAQLAMITAVSALSEYRDDATGKHIERTSTFCRLIARELQRSGPYSAYINDAYVDQLHHAAPLHDIGKVGVPDSILLKPGPLTPQEFEVMKTHTLIGAETLQRVQKRFPNDSFIHIGIAITRSHHERWDGTGYPDQLRGDGIPLSARIMAVADVYDALRAERPYKEAFPRDRAVKIIEEGKGSHFDPDIVQAFTNVEEEFHRVHQEYACAAE